MKTMKEDIQRAANLLEDVLAQLDEAEDAPVLTREALLEELGSFASPGMLEVQLRCLRDLREMRASADSEDVGDLDMTITVLTRLQDLTRR